MSEKKLNTIVLGIITGAALGSISAYLAPKNTLSTVKDHTSFLANRAKNMSERVLNDIMEGGRERRDHSAGYFFSGTALGALVGTGLLLLLAPKSRRELVKDLLKKYEDASEKSQEVMEYFNGERQVPLRRTLRKATNHIKNAANIKKAPKRKSR
jgi:gas vesicle protein